MSEKQLLAAVGGILGTILALAFLFWLVFFGGFQYIQNLIQNPPK